MFFWNSLAFSMIQWMLAIWSLVPLPFLNPAWTTWKFMVRVLLKPGLENFEHYFTSMWDECNCVVLWVFFGIAFLRDWNENWPFPVLWPLLSFPNLLAYWVHIGHQAGACFLVSYLFEFSYCLWCFCGKNTGVACHSLLKWATFCQNSSLWPVCLGWPCMSWLIASLSFASPFAMTRLLFMKASLYRHCPLKEVRVTFTP